MQRPTTIVLPDNDVGQLLDGIDVLIKQWEATARFLRTGECDVEVCVRECHNPSEAEAIAATYRRIRAVIFDQYQNQRTA